MDWREFMTGLATGGVVFCTCKRPDGNASAGRKDSE
jgi:hypothetical protein